MAFGCGGAVNSWQCTVALDASIAQNLVLQRMAGPLNSGGVRAVNIAGGLHRGERVSTQ